MKLYRSLGRIWTGTQKDAKEAQGGKDFEEIEVPTDKPGLMAWLNTFDVRPGDMPQVQAIQVVDDFDPADVLGEAMATVVGERATILSATHGPGSERAATACPACARDAKAAGMVASATAAICAAADIEDITDPDVLDGMIARLQRRREQVTVDPLDGLLG